MTTTGEGLSDKYRLQTPNTEQFGPRMNSAGEYILMAPHGVIWTHVDALAHIFWDGKMYNGKPAELVSAYWGATVSDITVSREGVFTRGVLFDIAALRGVDWLEPGEGVYPEELEAAEERMGIRVGRGDAVLLRTGYGRRRREIGPYPEAVEAGWQAACLPWFHKRGVAVIGCDTANDVIPSGYRVVRLPIHAIGIVAMGLWTIDNCDLEQLASTCADFNRWEFLFTFDTLPIVGSTSSPVNPIATF